MIPGAYPPSSPTPHLPNPAALISTSTSPTGRALHRASSLEQPFGSTGYVTASGLSTWRRGVKRSGSSSNKGWKLGLGMGKDSTPGRKKARTTGSKSIGYQSTPKASTIRPSRHSASASSASTSLASLPDPDETQLDSFHSAPDIPSPDVSPIPKVRRQQEDVFGMMTYIEPSRSTAFHNSHSRSSDITSPGDTPTQTMEDITVPVNFPSSEIQSPSLRVKGEEDTFMEVARAIVGEGGASHYDFVMPLKMGSSEQDIEEEEGDDVDLDRTARPGRPVVSIRADENEEMATGEEEEMEEVEDRGDTITHEDITVKLNDKSEGSSRRLGTVLSDGIAVPTRFTSSRGGSKTRERVSTPYRGGFARFASSSNESQETSSRGSLASRGSIDKDMMHHDEDEEEQEQVEEVEEGPSKSDHLHHSTGISSRAAEDKSVPQWDHGDEDDGPKPMTRSERSRSARQADETNDEQFSSDGEVGRGSSLNDETEGDIELEPLEPLDVSFDQLADEDIRSHRNATPVSSSFEFPPLVQGVHSPVPYLPSSQLGTPLRYPDVSPVGSRSLSGQRSGASSSLSPVTASTPVIQTRGRGPRRQQR